MVREIQRALKLGLRLDASAGASGARSRDRLARERARAVSCERSRGLDRLAQQLKADLAAQPAPAQLDPKRPRTLDLARPRADAPPRLGRRAAR
jgi:hypothetical protein